MQVERDVVAKWGHLLTDARPALMTQPLLQSYANAVFAKSGYLRHVVAFIDGTLRPCCRSGGAGGIRQRVLYSGHKRRHGIKFQSVSLPNGIIWHLWGPVGGSRNDNHMLAASNMIAFLTAALLPFGFYIYGDAAYPMSPVLMVGYDRILATVLQLAFNKAMSRSRITVEWCFGKVLLLFPHLDFARNLRMGRSKIQPLGQKYRAGVILTNFHTCLYGSATSQYFGLTPPTLEQYWA